MRQLHPVSFHEQFLASGTYIYERANQPTDTTENWTIHRLPDTSRLIRTDYQSPWISILREILSDSDGHIQRFDIHLYNRVSSDKVKQSKATYIIFETEVQVQLQINDEDSRHEDFPLTRNTVINPSDNILTGSIIHQVLERGGENVSIYEPKLVISAPDTKQITSGMIDQCSVSFIDHETYTISGQPQVVSRYQFMVGYHEGIAGLDDSGLLVIYEEKSFRVTLKNYARSPDFKL